MEGESQQSMIADRNSCDMKDLKHEQSFLWSIFMKQYDFIHVKFCILHPICVRIKVLPPIAFTELEETDDYPTLEAIPMPSEDDVGTSP